ncbi:L-2-amino-thiazoline-4-carboxylic acid hydrolase [Saccharothrix luteola]|uniref:L-2-amino-thiazoline-4-carboxylic acid hydrolase n=1 Tax=Saccharothrix luteola TaxID=2893018 RepID=UPI001E2824FF|nr:L-2-amino-thiazoline-4-carboxylic acid hydrolase [Saccharothrix luteola]MCC8247821.1 L-2-amino-thiazoline-4-carboxylic acid hydrolase [Saccharothrix luteola]
MNEELISLFREHVAALVPLPEVDAAASRIAAAVGGSSPHLPVTALVAGAYQCLLRRMPRSDALRSVARAFHEPIRPYVHDGTKAALDAADDPFTVITGMSKDREENYFGDDFAFTRSESASHYHVDVHRCFYVRVLAVAGVPELGEVFCDFDAAWIDAIDPDRHRVTFRRPTTIARGGSTCPFHFDRT